MSDFTKGKWTYNAKTGYITSDGYTIITVCYPETAEGQAIGRLVESAPEMYELLEAFVNSDIPTDSIAYQVLETATAELLNNLKRR